MILNHRSLTAVMAGAIAFAIVGCSSVLEPRPDPTKFYLLTAASESGRPAVPAPPGAAGDFVLGLGPVNLPAYLDRPEIVTRAAPNRLELSKTDRWGESLQNNFTQVLSRDLAAQLGTQRIVIYPWYATTQIDLQVQLEVYRFETDAQGKSELTAKWTISDGATKGILYITQSDIAEASKRGDATAAAAALSRAVDDLSREIATQGARLRTH